MNAQYNPENEPRPPIIYDEELTRQRAHLMEISDGLMDPEHRDISLIEYVKVAEKLKAQRTRQYTNNGNSLNLADYSYRKVLNDLKYIDLLDRSQEASLFFLIKSGHGVLDDENSNIAEKELVTPVLKWAREEAVHANLRLVASIVRIKPSSFFMPAVDKDDYFSNGEIGLLRGVDMFDWTKGFRFSTYAVWWIEQSIDRGIIKEGPLVYLPFRKDVMNKYIGIEMGNLSTGKIDKGDATTEEWLSLRLGITPEDAKEALVIYTQQKRAESLDKPYGQMSDDNSSNMYDFVSNKYDSTEQKTEQIDYGSEIEQLMSVLDERETFIINQRFGIGIEYEKTLAEVSKSLRISRERVRQIQVAALAKMNESASRNKPKDT